MYIVLYKQYIHYLISSMLYSLLRIECICNVYVYATQKNFMLVNSQRKCQHLWMVCSRLRLSPPLCHGYSMSLWVHYIKCNPIPVYLSDKTLPPFTSVRCAWMAPCEMGVLSLLFPWQFSCLVCLALKFFAFWNRGDILLCTCLYCTTETCVWVGAAEINRVI